MVEWLRLVEAPARVASAHCSVEMAVEGRPHHKGEEPRDMVEGSLHHPVEDIAGVGGIECRTRDIAVAYLESHILAAVALAVAVDEDEETELGIVGSPARMVEGRRDIAR